MKYFEVNAKNMVSIDDDRAIIAESVDEGVECLKIGEDMYLPFIGWMKYDQAENAWIEIEQDEEEKIIGTVAEDCTFAEIPASEIERPNGNGA